jgi:plastocyanin
MRRPAGALTATAALAVAAVLAVPAAAAPREPAPVSLQFDVFAPTQVDLLPGESVQWSNVSARTHTVTFDDGTFDSGDVAPGAAVVRRFDVPGAFGFHCRLHAGMVGQVDVRRVTLDALPLAPVPAGARVEVTGRVADPGAAVTVEADTGRGPRPVGRATAAPDGTWSATLRASAAADVRAVAGADGSQTRRLLVTDRRVEVHATRRGVTATVTPAFPGARVRLQVLRRERFGWWPAATARLDYLSRVAFRLPGRARVRVVLVDRDGWTPLATSRALRLRS